MHFVYLMKHLCLTEKEKKKIKSMREQILFHIISRFTFYRLKKKLVHHSHVIFRTSGQIQIILTQK